MKQKMTTPESKTFGSVWDKFTHEDRMICLRLVQKTDHSVTAGTLPFISLAQVAIAVINADATRRIVQIREKIRKCWGIKTPTDTPMYLKDGRVAHFFGSHPERGRPMNITGTKRVTVGVKWSLPKKDYIPDDDVLVVACVALRRASKNFWYVDCEPEYQERVELWLIDHCR